MAVTSDLEISEEVVCQNLIVDEGCTLTLKEKSNLLVNGDSEIGGTLKIESCSEFTAQMDVRLYGVINIAAMFIFKKKKTDKKEEM